MAMLRCSQCRQGISWTQVDVLTGLCRRCQAAPHDTLSPTLRRWARRACILGLLLVAVLLAYCTPVLDVFFLDQRFSAPEWASGGVRIRGRMARNLIASRQLIGKDHDEVCQLLGPPDWDYVGVPYFYLVDVGYRWILQPRLYELMVCFDKVGCVFDVLIRPADAPPFIQLPHYGSQH